MSDTEQQPGQTEEWRESVEGKPFDLGLLWQVLEQHKETMAEQEEAGKGMSSTWELVVVQGALLTLLILVSICWAMCCRRRCGRGDPASQLSVAEALRKVSANKRDLPPSYSKLDLRQAGMSVQDYLNPPPNYLDLGENLQYLDLEQGHNRLAKLSFCNEDGSVARVARLSVASCENCNTESAVVVPVRQDRLSLSSSASSSVSSSRRQSRASSRVSFSEEVECSNGSIRRLSSNSLASLDSSRKNSSSSGDGSRKSSLISKVQRKMGSNPPDSFVDSLDAELRQKLATIGDGEPGLQAGKPSAATVTAESQAERAARICDIIVEEK